MKQQDKYKNIEDRIDQYVKGELSQREIDQLWSELIEHPYYIDYLKTVANVQHLVREDAAGYSSPSKTVIGKIGNFKTAWVGAAAAILLTLSIVSVLLVYNGETELSPEVAPLEAMELHNLRSSVVIAEEKESRLQKGINEAARGESANAIRLFEELNRELEPEDPFRKDVYLNIGIVQYNDGNLEEAESAFKAIIGYEETEPLMREKAFWYLGNVYLKTGDESAARDAIRQAYEINGAFRRVTGKYLEKLGSDING